ncbi:MAG: amidohydrolase/deacetylase family metallohydrolase [Thermomicrobiales bacterium]|nr:amidohydrolase/deacetylase family metallohydrolase [Thermomicrobiales bacterium]
MYSLIVKGARVIDPAQGIDAVADIAVDAGKIVGIGDYAAATASRVVEAGGLIASPGWVDLHVHCFPDIHVFGGDGTLGSVDADTDCGIATGVTTVIDAGTSGAGTWKAFRDLVVDRHTTRVLAFMNVSLMPRSGPRHGDWQNFSQGLTIRMAEEEAEAGVCLGIKVLASQNHCGNLGNIPMQLAVQASRLSGTGLMVHLGEAPPIIQDVLNQMDDGDILTHCFKGTAGNLLGRDRKPLPETLAAVDRGVKFDIGHGKSSFSFDTCRYCLDAGLPIHAISTDIHSANIKGPVFDMATTMSKFLHLGFDLPEVIRLSTVSPAELIHRDHEFGTMHEGREADITLFRVDDGEFPVVDSEGKRETASQMIRPVHTIRAGELVHSAVA